jgi:MFS family permease
LVAICIAIVIIATLPETVTDRTRRRLTLKLGVPPEDRAVFWRVLVPSGALFSLFDGVCLSLIPVLEVRELGVTNYVLIGASGFLVLVSGAVSQVVFRALAPTPAIVWGLAIASCAFVGVIVGAPLGSAALVLISVSVTGAACGLVFKGGVDLCTRIAPPADRGKLISSYYVACYLGGFSVPLLVIGVLADLIGLTAALGVLTAAAAIGAAWTALIGTRSIALLRPQDATAH